MVLSCAKDALPGAPHGQQRQGLYMVEARVAGIPMRRPKATPNQLIWPFEGMKERSPVTVAMIPITCTHRERAIRQAFTA